jgi:hypothetical protein
MRFGCCARIEVLVKVSANFVIEKGAPGGNVSRQSRTDSAHKSEKENSASWGHYRTSCLTLLELPPLIPPICSTVDLDPSPNLRQQNTPLDRDNAHTCVSQVVPHSRKHTNLLFLAVCAMEGESSTPPRSMKSPVLQELKEEGMLVLYR